MTDETDIKKEVEQAVPAKPAPVESVAKPAADKPVAKPVAGGPMSKTAAEPAPAVDGKLMVKAKDIVVPGEVLAVGMGYLPSKGTYRDGENIVAAKLGLVQIEGKVLKLVTMSGRYVPKVGDVIIGQIIDVMMSGWRISTNTAYSAVLSMAEASSDYIEKGADLTQFFDLGEYIMTRLTNITSQKLIDVTMKGPGLKKLKGGRIVKVNPQKVPRLIGKQGSMVSLLKVATDCKIMVGQNGLVWIDGEPESELIVVDAIRMIEASSHVSGLTDIIKAHLEKITGKTNLADLLKEKLAQESQMQRERSEFRPRSGGGGRGRGPPRRGPPRGGNSRGRFSGPRRR